MVSGYGGLRSSSGGQRFSNTSAPFHRFGKITKTNGTNAGVIEDGKKIKKKKLQNVSTEFDGDALSDGGGKLATAARTVSDVKRKTAVYVHRLRRTVTMIRGLSRAGSEQ